MTGYTANTKIYNDVFTENYDYLLRWADYNADRMHDCYFKVLKQSTGFTATTLNNIKTQLVIYLKTSIRNTFLTEMRLKKNNVLPEHHQKAVEDKLRLDENYNEDNESEIQQLEYTTKRMFDYIQTRYSEQELYVFKCYFLYDERKKLTFKELSAVTGYSISKCCNIIGKMKTDIRTNLGDYING